jgi:hypothetical protein
MVRYFVLICRKEVGPFFIRRCNFIVGCDVIMTSTFIEVPGSDPKS